MTSTGGVRLASWKTATTSIQGCSGGGSAGLALDVSSHCQRAGRQRTGLGRYVNATTSIWTTTSARFRYLPLANVLKLAIVPQAVVGDQMVTSSKYALHTVYVGGVVALKGAMLSYSLSFKLVCDGFAAAKNGLGRREVHGLRVVARADGVPDSHHTPTLPKFRVMSSLPGSDRSA